MATTSNIPHSFLSRQKLLSARRALKMASSAHAFVRGSTVQFYKWLEERGERAVPDGPSVWICGDCHAGNLGPLAASDGSVVIQIRDLDQTVIGNPNHDLIRLALSLASAARGSDLPGVTTAHMLEEMMVGYRRALTGHHRLQSERPECVRVVMRRAHRRTWKHLARERLRDLKPNIPRDERFWHLSAAEGKAVRELFQRDEVRRLVTSLKSRPDGAEIEILDAAYWVKGCSSLGRLRYAVLLETKSKEQETGDYCLIDIKEAHAASAPRTTALTTPTDNGERVVEGAKHLSPALGERMLASRFLSKSIVLRELMPQDLKLEIDRLTRVEALASARYLAEVVGHAHARQMDRTTRKEFAATFRTRRAAQIDAPSWLWSGVVELVAAHEGAYLEHCRRYAMGSQARHE